MMPYRPKKPCSYPGCPNLTDKRYCPEHAKLQSHNYEVYKRDPHKSERYGKGWKSISKRFLSEHPFCEICKKDGRAVVATLVHHIKPVREGGTNDEDNLMALCQSCHSRLHAKRGDIWHNR